MIAILAGIPNHPLFVHIPVVLVPLAAIGALAIAIRPKWMQTYGPVVLAISFLGFVGAVIAGETGEELEDKFRDAGQTISKTLERHAELGDSAKVVAAGFFFFMLLWVGFAWWRRRVGEEQAVAKVKKPKVIAIVLLVLACASGIGSTVSMIVTGHNGAEAVWKE